MKSYVELHGVWTYHDDEGLALVGDANAATALAAGLPDILGDTCGAIDGGRKSVVGESTGTVLPAVFFLAVQAIASAHASVQGAAKQVTVVRRVGRQKTGAGLQRESCESDGGRDESRHFDGVLIDCLVMNVIFKASLDPASLGFLGK